MMSILAAAILATESAQLRDAARARLQAGTKPRAPAQWKICSPGAPPQRAKVAEAARRHADRLNPDKLIELQVNYLMLLNDRRGHLAAAPAAAESLRVAEARLYACKHENHQRAARARVEVTAK